MKVTAVMVSTINGRITRGDDPDITKWTSKEDGAHFRSMVAESTLIVMGSSTYEAARESMRHREGKLRIVLTHTPEKYSQDVISGQLEFSNESPKELVQRLEQQGYQEMLLVGGGQTNAQFLKDGVLTDLFLTIEPKAFGKGKLVLGEEDYFVNAHLASVKPLNEHGTLLMHYTFVYE